MERFKMPGVFQFMVPSLKLVTRKIIGMHRPNINISLYRQIGGRISFLASIAASAKGSTTQKKFL